MAAVVPRSYSCGQLSTESCPSDFELYNGVSDRPRGWKSRASRASGVGQPSAAFKTRRWDGAARRAFQWDHLRKDPDLWHRNGDCFVHLYSKGQSQRGPAFKVPLSTLTAMHCQPLLDRFLDRSIPETPELDDSTEVDGHGGHSGVPGRIDLYIPAPASFDRDQAFQYHLCTRNFFAWLFRRSVVGETLSGALAGLLGSMQTFRTSEADNVGDFLDFLDEEGYLELSDQPGNALAILQVAETFRITDLYTEAFAHCVGMYSRLFSEQEYQLLSSESRKAIRKASVQQGKRLDAAGSMLRTFLEDELAEANLGLPAPARAHLDRFRSFLLTFYATKYGYYPPPSVKPGSTSYRPDVYRGMLSDFKAMYEYLVDESFTSGESGPPLAQGGICALQCLYSFESRRGRSLLQHPLPLLPETTATGAVALASSRGMSWLGKGAEMLRSDNRHESYAALMKATNKTKVELLRNRLVCAYRQFEHNLIFSPLKGDRRERMSQVDARKVRWILIYCVYQTLQECAGPPPEVRDPDATPYIITVAKEDLPPWTNGVDGARIIPSTTENWVVQLPAPSLSSGPGSLDSTPMSIEIKPDIDYFALTRESTRKPSTNAGFPTALDATTVYTSARTKSLTRSLSRNCTLQRSLTFFKGQPSTSHPPPPRTRRSSYHEIVVLGYGNGTNAVNTLSADAPTPHTNSTATRSPSTASSNSSVGTEPSMTSSDVTVDSVLTVPDGQGDCGIHLTAKESMPTNTDSETSTPDASCVSKSHTRRAVSSPDAHILALRTRNGTPPIPEKSSARRCVSMVVQPKSKGSSELQPAPLQIRKLAGRGDDTEMPLPLKIDTTVGQETFDMWDQYGNLGGHTPLELVRPVRSWGSG